MADIQKGISKKNILTLNYYSNKQEHTNRDVEPIGVVYYSGRWHLIAWCRLRNGYRDFRIDFIQSMKNTGQIFDSRNLYTLKEYFKSLMQAHEDMIKVVVSFERSVSHYVKNARYYYGYVTEEELEGRCHMSFLIVNMRSFCRWLLMYGTAVEIESPEALRQTMEEMVEEISQHYKLLTVR